MAQAPVMMDPNQTTHQVMGLHPHQVTTVWVVVLAVNQVFMLAAVRWTVYLVFHPCLLTLFLPLPHCHLPTSLGPYQNRKLSRALLQMDPQAQILVSVARHKALKAPIIFQAHLHTIEFDNRLTVL